MVIEHEFFSEQFERYSYEKESVGRIVSMNHIKTVPHEEVSANEQTSGREVAIFHKVAKRRSQFQETQTSPIKVCRRSFFEKFQLGDTINLNAVYNLGCGLVPFSKGDH
jgi:hypothetical protein